MFGIDFYIKVNDFKYRPMGGERLLRKELINTLESYRSEEPIVYNIEITNDVLYHDIAALLQALLQLSQRVQSAST